MKDFTKIFIGISALVAAFVFGSNYGEKTFRETSEYKSFIKATEELNFAKAELENVKAKLQNITDQAETKKTDELLAQILHVFLTDLGLRIQNKDAILKNAQQSPTPVVIEKPQPVITKAPVEPEIKVKKPEQKKWSNLDIKKYKSYEWMLENASGDRQTMDLLKKVHIKNITTYLGESQDVEAIDLESFKGTYKGSVLDINNKYFGSLSIKIDVVNRSGINRVIGELSFYREDANKSVRIFDGESLGKNINGLLGIVIDDTRDRFFHLYKLKNSNKLAGNYYESLPHGTTNLIGSYILKRVDL